jgi:hypothetical protein
MEKTDCKVQLCEIYQAIKQLWKKTADMVTKAWLSDPNNGLESIYIKGKYIGLYNSRFPDDADTPNDVGGIPAGTTAGELRWTNLTEMMDKLLFPFKDAYISTPKSATLVSNIGEALKEVGSSIGIELTATLNKGSITNGDETPGPALVGNATNYKFTGTGIPETNQESGFLPLSFTVEEGENKWHVDISHAEGTGSYYDSEGNESTHLDMERVAGNVANESEVTKGIYPFFYGGSVNDLSSGGTDLYQALNKEIIEKSSEVGLTINISDEYMYFAYPDSYGEVQSIKDGNGFVVTDSFDLTVADVISTGLGANYTILCKIYKTSAPTTVSNQIYTLNF